MGVPFSSHAADSSVCDTQWRAVSTRFGARSVPVHSPTSPVALSYITRRTTASWEASDVVPLITACRPEPTCSLVTPDSTEQPTSTRAEARSVNDARTRRGLRLLIGSRFMTSNGCVCKVGRVVLFFHQHVIASHL